MKAKNLKMSEYLFHGIRPYEISIEHPEKLTVYQKKMEKCCQITKKILKTGEIFPKQELKQILSESEYFDLLFSHRKNWNEHNAVSICTHPNNKRISDINLSNSEIGQYDEAYEYYVTSYPALILNPSLLKDLSIRSDSHRRMIGEIQIEGKIPTSYIVGISLPDPNIFEQSLNNVTDFIHNPFKYKNDYLIHGIIRDIQTLSEEDFLNTYYYEVICFERMLKEINSDLKLYHTDTGYPIKSSKEQIKLIRKIKKQI